MSKEKIEKMTLEESQRIAKDKPKVRLVMKSDGTWVEQEEYRPIPLRMPLYDGWGIDCCGSGVSLPCSPCSG